MINYILNIPTWETCSNLTHSTQMVPPICQNFPGTGIQGWIIQSAFSHRIYIQICGNPKYTNTETISHKDKYHEENRERGLFGNYLGVHGSVSEEVT